MSETIKRKSVGFNRWKAGPWWYGPVHFAVHIFVGTAIFGFIALAAVGLAFLNAWARTLTYGGQLFVSSLLVDGLTVGECMLFAIDLVLFVVFLGKTAWRMSKEL